MEGILEARIAAIDSELLDIDSELHQLTRERKAEKRKLKNATQVIIVPITKCLGSLIRIQIHI